MLGCDVGKVYFFICVCIDCVKVESLFTGDKRKRLIRTYNESVLKADIIHAVNTVFLILSL